MDGENLTLKDLLNQQKKFTPDIEIWIYDEHADRERPALYAEMRNLPDSDKQVFMIGV